jgi:hypothetical protein
MPCCFGSVSRWKMTQRAIEFSSRGNCSLSHSGTLCLNISSSRAGELWNERSRIDRPIDQSVAHLLRRLRRISKNKWCLALRRFRPAGRRNSEFDCFAGRRRSSPDRYSARPSGKSCKGRHDMERGELGALGGVHFRLSKILHLDFSCTVQFRGEGERRLVIPIFDFRKMRGRNLKLNGQSRQCDLGLLASAPCAEWMI